MGESNTDIYLRKLRERYIYLRLEILLEKEKDDDPDGFDSLGWLRAEMQEITDRYKSYSQQFDE